MEIELSQSHRQTRRTLDLRYEGIVLAAKLLRRTEQTRAWEDEMKVEIRIVDAGREA